MEPMGRVRISHGRKLGAGYGSLVLRRERGEWIPMRVP